MNLVNLKNAKALETENFSHAELLRVGVRLNLVI